MKIVVIYKSKTGFSKKYAQWIADELSADIFEISESTIEIIKTYDIVIFGGSLHAVGISGINFITKNFDKLKNKKIVVFATGASPARENVIREVTSRNFTLEQQKSIKFFYLRGGFDYNKLGFIDKILMTVLKMKMKNKKELTSDEKGMLTAYSNPVDFTKRENIKELISYVKS